MGQVIKIGVIGLANIATRSLIPAIQNLPHFFQLNGVASRSTNKLTKLNKFITTINFFNYQDLLDNEDIDAVYIPLPTGLHAEWVEKSLQKGKHVLVEKSLACSFDEVIKLINLAREKRLALVENFQFRFHPQTNLILEVLGSGQLGELRCLRASFGFPPLPDENNIRYNFQLGGGALLDAGAYTTKVSQLLLGNDLKVCAASLNFCEKNKVDIWGGAYLQNMKTGIFAELAFGFDNFYQCGIEVWGSKGKLTTNRLFSAPPGFSPEIFIETENEKQKLIAPSSNHFEKMLMHFYDIILSQDRLEKEYEQNLDQARLLDEIKNVAYVQ